jgi:hypothetical protein
MAGPGRKPAKNKIALADHHMKPRQHGWIIF